MATSACEIELFNFLSCLYEAVKGILIFCLMVTDLLSNRDCRFTDFRYYRILEVVTKYHCA